MIDDTDLDAAVTAGIVTQDQSDSLRRFVASRQPQKDVERADDERFRFMRGFNDVFFAVGIALFVAGLSFFASVILLGHLIAAAITWALSELVVRRLRLVLPGILLACVFTYFAIRMVDTEWRWIAQKFGLPAWLAPGLGFPASLDTAFYPPMLAVKALVATCAAALFYLRFRLPFTLLLIAAGLVVFAQLKVWAYVTNDGMTFVSLMLLLCGLGVFAAAMVYDLSDRDRVTRRSDCAFWLHLLAAPLIVHSIFQLLVPGSTFGRLAGSLTMVGAVIVVGVIVVLTVVALLIDRRALFVSALSYLGIVIGYTITTAAGRQESDTFAIFATLTILGVLVLALGVAWRPLRRMIVRWVPAVLTDRLPRVALA